MHLTLLDWTILAAFLLLSLGIGAAVAKRAGKDSTEFFLSGRHMPWWLLGFSMVATTFSTDTPNLVTDLVRQNGVAANWAWWSFLITGIVTVFFYAGLWRRSGVLTDLELYEIRYSGRAAAVLRGFRALYLGVFVNVLIMATVTVAAIKIGETLLGWDRYQSVSVAMLVTVVFSSMGGFRGVILTDFVLFILSMFGSVAAAYFAVNHPKVGGLTRLLENPLLADKLSMIPTASAQDADSWSPLLGLLLMPLLVQWWSAWYPGAEPGGGGYLAQRMLAAKNDRHAVGAVLFFQVAHYAIRPWPWVLVALASIVVFPTVGDIEAAFPTAQNIANDSAYSAMLTFLPPGWLGLVLTSLVAAYMSTISTHLNWGASYVVNDFWKPYVETNASETKLVWVGRLATVAMMVIAAFVAFQIDKASDAFSLLVSLGAGTGGVLLARWYWWRVNAVCEIVAIVSAAAVSLSFQFTPAGCRIAEQLGPWSIAVQVASVTAIWVAAAFLTPPTEFAVLKRFVEHSNPGGPGWRRVQAEADRRGEPLQCRCDAPNLSMAFFAASLGCVFVYGLLFTLGYFICGQAMAFAASSAVTAASGVGVGMVWARVQPRAATSDA